jgi:hypothetical protein
MLALRFVGSILAPVLVILSVVTMPVQCRCGAPLPGPHALFAVAGARSRSLVAVTPRTSLDSATEVLGSVDASSAPDHPTGPVASLVETNPEGAPVSMPVPRRSVLFPRSHDATPVRPPP